MHINRTEVAKRFILGCWRLNKWPYSITELNSFIHQVIDVGIDTFDHADIYGDYSCEKLFGCALNKSPHLRKQIKLTTKCGIKLPSKNFPEHSKHIYDTSYQHIISSVERSLINLGTDYIDLLLIHRPDPLLDVQEVASAFAHLKKQGKVINFGVSNFLPIQLEMLQTYLNFPLVTNQIEASVLKHEHFINGNFDYLQMRKIRPQIWSPLAGGQLFAQDNLLSVRVLGELERIAKLHQVEPEVIALAWLLKLPSQPQIVLGSGKIERIIKYITSYLVNLSREEWFGIWTTCQGRDIP